MTNFCLLFWDMGCDIRRQNTKISWNELKKLSFFLKKKGLDFNVFLFEFGNNFLFEDSIKIDFFLEYFDKSKKNNLIINHEVNKTCDYIGIMDSDLFFSEEQYQMVFNHIVELELSDKNIFFTYNLLDIHEQERNEIIDTEKLEIIKHKIEKYKSKYSWRHSWGSGVLGGLYIAPISKLKIIGGFNENFLTWGAEDDDAHTRLKSHCSWIPKMNEGPYHLYHPKNESDVKYFIPVYSEKYFEVNKVEKPN